MTPYFEQKTMRRLDALPDDVRTVWLFEGQEARRAAERSAAQADRELRVRSAYKTLLHDVLEDGLMAGARRAVVHYPVIDGCEANRFLLECYPLHALFPDCELIFVACKQTGRGMPSYRLDIERESEQREAVNVPVPVRWTTHPNGDRCLAACGWYQDSAGHSRYLLTEYEELFTALCRGLEVLPLEPLPADEPDGPFFERLVVSLHLPFEEMPLAVDSECVSLAEALHEEIYFSALEIFRRRLGLETGQRSVKIGQIVPLVVHDQNPALSVYGEAARSADIDDRLGCPTLEDLDRWLYPGEIEDHLTRLSRASHYHARSRQGRIVPGVFVAGNGPARLAISAGQHPNESSPMVGAQRAARALHDQGRVSFTLNALENPDGYALFRELCTHSPRHMNHAARYTASGADLVPKGGGYESAIRDLAREQLPCSVHVNLHGYPSHEWTRPLTGYIPDGFALWTLPKGFFVILRHAPSHAELAHRVLTAALEALAAYEPLAKQNRAMLERYQRYATGSNFSLHADCVPYTVSEVAEAGYPVTLITEAPDETVYGEDFRIAHEAQFRVVMAVSKALESSQTGAAE